MLYRECLSRYDKVRTIYKYAGEKEGNVFDIYEWGFVMRVTLAIFIYFFGGWEDPEIVRFVRRRM